MKRRSFLETLLKKAGIADAELTELFTDLEGELDDAKATAYLATLLTADEAKGNDTIFGEVKRKTKADALDPIDKLLTPYEKKLSAEQKTEYGKLGADSYKKYQFLLKHFDEAGTKTGDKNFDELQGKYNDLQGKIDAGDYVPKGDVERYQTAASEAQKQSQHTKILVSAIRSGKLKDVSTDRHFERNFIADAESLLGEGLTVAKDTKQKGVLDYVTGNIMRADSPDQPLLINGRGATVADLADQVITNYDWAKKGDTAPVNPLQVEQGGQGGANRSAASIAMMQMENDDRK